MTSKNGRPQSSKTGKGEQIKRISIFLSETQHQYLAELALRSGLKVSMYTTEIVEQHLDKKILTKEIEFNFPRFKKQNSSLIPILKALIYGHLSEQEKLTDDVIRDASTTIGCSEEDIRDLLKQIH